MELVIDRSQWLTGLALRRLRGDSTLRHESGLQCCLGIYLTALRVFVDHVTMPGGLPEGSLPEEATWLTDGVFTDSPRACRLQTLNDNPILRRATRERKIAEVFAEVGVTVTYTGDYGDAVKTAVSFLVD